MLMGASYRTSISYAYQETSQVVPKASLSKAMGIVVGVQYFSVFVAAYITTGLMALMHTDLLTPVLIFPACWILIFVFVEYKSIQAYEEEKIGETATYCEETI